MRKQPESRSQSEPVLVSWSGGKDSALALGEIAADNRFRIAGLVTTVTRGYDRVSVHGVRRVLLHQQAEALGFPLHEVTIDPACDNAAYERAFESSLVALKNDIPGLERIVFGDLFLADVRAYRETLLARLGMTGIFPIWGWSTVSTARDFASRYSAVLACVDTTQLPAEFSGRLFDLALLADLPESADPCGENGEFHTFVSRGPGFNAEVAFTIGERVLRDDRFAYTDLLPA